MSSSLYRKIAQKIDKGLVVPLISNVATNDLVLGGHVALAEKYRGHITYPLDGEDNFPRLAQYKYVTDEDIEEAWDLEDDYKKFIKTQLLEIAKADKVTEDTIAEVEDEFDDLPLAEFCERLSYPRFHDSKNDPLLILADFPLPIYVTTSYHNFIEVALRRADKKPRTEICRWHKGLESIPSVFDDEDYEPTKDEPLVYHLHGLDEHPESLVLTEDNYLEFLVAISEFRSQEGDQIAARVRQALAESALIMLGYSLRGWDFRTLFWGLIQQRPRQPQSVSVQLKRSSEEERYLKEYFSKAKFEVYWGDINTFLKDLQRG